LNAEECGLLVANLLADDSVDPIVRSRIAEAAEGHPLYAEEITGLLVDEGRLVLKDGRWVPTGDLGDLPIPPTISALLASRLDRLPPLERGLIEIASVTGQLFYPAAVRELSDEASEAVEVGLAALVRKQFVRPERSDLPATDALGFRHLLIRDAAYGSIPKADRAEIHEGFGEWLDRSVGALGERDEIVGYHFEQAYRYRLELGPPDERTRSLADRAGERLAAAGRSALARWDVTATANLLGRAAQLFASDDRRRIEILPDLGLALSRTDLPRADEVLAEAVEAARAAGEQRLEARASVRRVETRLVLDPATGQEESLREAQRFAQLFEGWEDDQGLADSLQLVGTIHFWAGKNALAERELERARTHARLAGSRASESEIDRLLILAISQGTMRVPDAITRLRGIMERAGNDRRVEAAAASKLAELEAMRGRFEVARELIERAIDFTRELGDQVATARSLADSARVEMLAGEPSTAERDARAAVDIVEAVGSVGHLASEAPSLGDVLYALGRYDEAMELAELTERITVRGDVDAEVRWRQLQAKVLARRGRPDEADRLARDAVRIVASTEYLDLHVDALFALAEVSRLADRNADAAEALREARTLSRQKGNLVAVGRADALLAEPRTSGGPAP
jgi:tetratricopeptide (TPR) repeat protein